MLFNSIHFVLFFIIVTAGYFLLPHKYRWMLLLASSVYFYMYYIPVYILVLVFIIIIDYTTGIFIERVLPEKSKALLFVSLIINISVLLVFKYYDFFAENFSSLLNSIGYPNHIGTLGYLLPIGLSFHTFQSMSYVIEVYRGTQKAEQHFGKYALYVLFYPQLVAGPIERPQNLLYQFYQKHEFDYDRIVDGLKLMLWGFFMKVVIADRLAIYVNTVYNNEGQHYGKTFLLATIFFSFQIYCDFGGYSNIAIGAANVMGFKLNTNFNRPYFSKTISEFWKRWHISLSTWFRDYLYIPLGGNKVSDFRWCINIFLVFLISGLWHGAEWTFIVWGALHGIYLICAIASEKWQRNISLVIRLNRVPQLMKSIEIILTFVLVAFAWIFFRANSLTDGLDIVRKIFAFNGSLFIDKTQISYSILVISLLFIIEFFQGRRKDKKHLPFCSVYRIKEQVFYSVMFISILLFGVFDGNSFIYFQF